MSGGAQNKESKDDEVNTSSLSDKIKDLPKNTDRNQQACAEGSATAKTEVKASVKVEGNKKATSFKCPHCQAVLNRKFNFNRHLLRKHKGMSLPKEDRQTIETGNCVCLQCGFKCHKIVQLRDHLSRQHGMIFRCETVSFENKGGECPRSLCCVRSTLNVAGNIVITWLRFCVSLLKHHHRFLTKISLKWEKDVYP